LPSEFPLENRERTRPAQVKLFLASDGHSLELALHQARLDRHQKHKRVFN
jgi:hypothetical protein